MYKNVKLPDTGIFDDNMSKLFYEQNPYWWVQKHYTLELGTVHFKSFF